VAFFCIGPALRTRYLYQEEKFMALPSQTLAAIQAAGAAIFAADAALKESVQSYAELVKVAMLENPFNMGNDSLFDDWKTVARLSRAVTQVEAEFQKIYAAASDLSVGAGAPVLAMPTLTAPQLNDGSDLAMVQEVDATDAVIKKSPQTPLPVNAAKVLSHLLKILNPNDFVKINRAAIALEIGMPKGSIGASLSKLIHTGHMVEGSIGTYKLGVPKAGR
jgi:hypothetical protein